MRAIRFFLFLLIVLLLAPAAPADWLVTKEGARIETKGPWKVKGAIVVFTLPNGTLSSMRVRELDLDQSALVTAEADKPSEEEPTEEGEKPPKPVVAEFTNENIPRAALPGASAPGEAGGGGQAGASEASPPAAVATSPYEVLAWNVVDRPDVEGIEVRGTLRNAGEETAANVSVVLRLVTPDNVFVAERRGDVQSPLLRAQAATNFSAVFPNLSNEPYKLEVDVASR